MKHNLVKAALWAAALISGFAAAAEAQSTSQDFPTPITENEISGTIKARDLGDSRLTTYYFALNGTQGDLFINLVTRNFTGDIDVFTATNQQPLTKIVVYADYGEAETGRAIYLRKPEKLLLRVQGRTPNDDDATFRLKFAGSFAAVRPEDVPSAPDLPKVASESRSGIRVNSVGTILPSPSKPAESVDQSQGSETAAARSEPSDEPSPTANEPREAKPRLVLENPIRSRPADKDRSTASRNKPSKADKKAETPAKEQGDRRASEPASPGADRRGRTTEAPPVPTLANRRRNAAKEKEEPKLDPLDSINLVIQFKDGNSLQKKMSEVFKFSVDKGVLTVVLKDGSITRYPIVDVAKVTIE